MYEGKDQRAEGHLCIRDLNLKNVDLRKQVDYKEQHNVSLENKIKQLQTDVRERDTLISKMCEDHDNTVVQSQTTEKMGVLNKERQNLQSKLNQLREELSFS